MTKPLLSIGMIVKNEARSLEKCLKALEPLRNALPCELIIADTGSTDATREIAQRYADLVFDFPWVNDFSAARNAVMDRASGKWYFTVDADEYLDPDISQLVEFLSLPRDKQNGFAAVVQRNYHTRDMAEDDYSDFMAQRLARRDTGARYEGQIHETWPQGARIPTRLLERVILHHDGYTIDDLAAKKAKKILDGRGVVFGYHNHAHEYEGGNDYLGKITSDADLKAEIDVFWVTVAGKDAVSELRRFEGRLSLVHIKEAASEDPRGSAQPVVGEGAVDMRGVFAEAKKQGIPWAILEVEKYPCAEEEYLKRSLENMKKLEK